MTLVSRSTHALVPRSEDKFLEQMKQSGLVDLLQIISVLRAVQVKHAECGDECYYDKIPLPSSSSFSVALEQKLNPCI